VAVDRRSSLDVAGSHPQLIETLPELRFPFPQNMGQKGQKETADAQPVCLIVLFVPTFDVRLWPSGCGRLAGGRQAGGRRSPELTGSRWISLDLIPS